jgi:hypothetical protein
MAALGAVDCDKMAVQFPLWVRCRMHYTFVLQVKIDH